MAIAIRLYIRTTAMCADAACNKYLSWQQLQDAINLELLVKCVVCISLHLCASILDDV